MEAMCIKVDDRVMKNIETCMKKYNYSTKTEFVREAIRDKLNEFNTIQELRKIKGAAKTRVSKEEHEKIRDQISRKYSKKFGIPLD